MSDDTNVPSVKAEIRETAEAWEVLAAIEDFILWPQQDGEDCATTPRHLHAELADHSSPAWVLDAVKEVFRNWWECDVERVRLERSLATGHLIGPAPELCDLTEEAAAGVVARLVARAEANQAPHLRRGQSIANEAAYWAPVVSMKATREGVDPFYDDEKIPAFLAFLRKNAAYIVEPSGAGGEE